MIVVVSVALAADFGSACDLCLRLGRAQFHSDVIGGDDLNDAISWSHQPDGDRDESIAHPVFALHGSKWPQPGGPGSPVTLTYSYHNMLDGGLKMPDGQPLPVDLIRASIEEALGLWAGVAPLHFVEVPDEGGPVTLGNYPDGQFGQIRIKHLWINGPDPPPPAQPIAKAMAVFPSINSNRAGDVFFDNGDPWQEAGTLSAPDILGATIHEVGHSLGLLHTNIPEANMYWIFRRTSGLGDGWLHPDDIAGIQAIYGSGVGSVTPLAIPIPEPAAWALGGIALCLATIRWRRRRLGKSTDKHHRGARSLRHTPSAARHRCDRRRGDLLRGTGSGPRACRQVA